MIRFGRTQPRAWWVEDKKRLLSDEKKCVSETMQDYFWMQ